jgi:DNA (cytosine-5)-methyltransferase 1
MYIYGETTGSFSTTSEINQRLNALTKRGTSFRQFGQKSVASKSGERYPSPSGGVMVSKIEHPIAAWVYGFVMPITFGSLFAGIGGFDLGFERAGMECIWQVEINDYAQKVLAKHWPKVHREADIKTVGKHNLECVDVICGGFPCQDISYAGRGAGLDGERSGLFFEAIRVVRELQPRVVVLENVAALLTRGLDRVLGTLAEIGYDAEWHCIPAAYVGAPHIRDRVFVLAYASGDRQFNGRKKRDVFGSERRQVGPMQSEPCIASEGGQDSDVADTKRIRGESKPEPANRRHERDTGQFVSSSEDVADTDSRRFSRNKKFNGDQEGSSVETSRRDNANRCSGSDWWATEPDFCRVAHGVPARVDRLRGLGNAVVPQVAELVGGWVVERLA